MGNDLDIILGYHGAMADGDAVEVAPDIVCMPFWTPEFCDAGVRTSIAARGFSHQPYDPVPGYEVSLAAFAPTLFEALQNDIGVCGRQFDSGGALWTTTACTMHL